MAESFLQLQAKEQSEIYRALSPQLSRSPAVLEKDVWVCWVLQTLFTMPGRLPMAFKGGTSLSKVFGAINRFSEDVDVTLDYRGLDTSFDPFTEGASKTQLKKFSEGLKSFVRDHAHSVVAPHFEKILAAEFGNDGYRIEVSADGELLRVHYPTVLEVPGDYMANSVLIEFGGRNITEPNEEHEVSPDIAEFVPELVFPHSRVSVLSPARTFWEKATILHAEYHRPLDKPLLKRYSRHYADVAAMAQAPVKKEALANLGLLQNVVRHKDRFYHCGWAKYFEAKRCTDFHQDIFD
jgi:hypothetical protein